MRDRRIGVYSTALASRSDVFYTGAARYGRGEQLSMSSMNSNIALVAICSLIVAISGRSLRRIEKVMRATATRESDASRLAEKKRTSGRDACHSRYAVQITLAVLRVRHGHRVRRHDGGWRVHARAQWGETLKFRAFFEFEKFFFLRGSS